VRRSSRTTAGAERGKRGGPSPLKPLEQSLLDQPINDPRNPPLALLLAPWFGSLPPLDRLGWIPPWESLFLHRQPVRFQKVWPLVDTQVVKARTPLVRPDLWERSSPVATLAPLFPEVLTKPWAFDGRSRWERIDPRSESPRLPLSFPVKGQWAGLAVLHIALKMPRLLAPPDRAGLQGSRAPTRPSADSYGTLRDHGWSLSPFPPLSGWDTPPVSRGQLLRFRCTTAGFTSLVFDGYGLRALRRTRPTSTPRIQFLFVGSHL
jgi:hypothetical protein